MRPRRAQPVRLTATRGAFTLVEVVAVLLLVAVLGATVTVSLNATRRASRLQDAVERLKDYDAAARDRARSSGRAMRLAFGTTSSRLQRVDATTGRPEGATIEFDRGVTVERVWIASEEGAAAATSGDVVCSSLGQTDSYAVLLLSANAARQWVVFAGLTGEVRLLKNDVEVEEIFKLLAPDRNDAR